MRIVAFVCLFAGVAMAAAPETQPSDAFRPGEVWLDTDGQPVNCHGGGFLFENGRYYWFGEFKMSRALRAAGKHVGVSCYASTDLYHWKNCGQVLSASPAGGELIDGCVIERPKVIFNAPTKKYVMWFHFEEKGHGYESARAAVATADSVTGPYVYQGSFRMNAGKWPTNDNRRHDEILKRDFDRGQMSRDMTLFVDDDGSAYQFAASEENQTLHISKLSDDYLRGSGVYTRVLVAAANEAPAVFKHAGKYYMISSGCTGWAPNAARSAVADHPMGPWKPLGNPCIGTDHQVDFTFDSQSTAVLPVQGKPGAFIYVGDRWNPKRLADSRYIWLPILFEDERPRIAWRESWELSAFDIKD